MEFNETCIFCCFFKVICAKNRTKRRDLVSSAHDMCSRAGCDIDRYSLYNYNININISRLIVGPGL